jgi:hypothetical protein
MTHSGVSACPAMCLSNTGAVVALPNRTYTQSFLETKICCNIKHLTQPTNLPNLSRRPVRKLSDRHRTGSHEVKFLSPVRLGRLGTALLGLYFLRPIYPTALSNRIVYRTIGAHCIQRNPRRTH